jgi:hypothetical protein
MPRPRRINLQHLHQDAQEQKLFNKIFANKLVADPDLHLDPNSHPYFKNRNGAPFQVSLRIKGE